MARENRDWGDTRIQGALANLDHHVARGTIANILRQHGIEPAPERRKRTTWHEFLKTHWDVLAAADFFTVELWTGRGLTRFAVLFVIDLATRRVEITGVTSEPDSAWVLQCGRRVPDAVDGFLAGKRFLLHDRDPLCSTAFRETLAAAGVEAIADQFRQHPPARSWRFRKWVAFITATNGRPRKRQTPTAPLALDIRAV